MLLVLIFLIKILARSKIFNIVKEKHGLNTLRCVRNYERLLKRHVKLKYDLNFLLKCKQEALIPNFAKPRFSIKTNAKITTKIGRLILETEIGKNTRKRR